MTASAKTDAFQMRAEFNAWVRDQGCDTDGAWSAWQGAWHRRGALLKATRRPALAKGELPTTGRDDGCEAGMLVSNAPNEKKDSQ